jgi:hypothetical protein
MKRFKLFQWVSTCSPRVHVDRSGKAVKDNRCGTYRVCFKPNITAIRLLYDWRKTLLVDYYKRLDASWIEMQ